MGRPRLSRFGGGFSLPFVLISAAILLIGGLALALRSSDGLLSVLLQAESSDARDAAETGITRIVGELNRPRNRGLLVKDGSAQDPGNYLWTRDAADASRNPCLPLASEPITGEDPEAPDLTGSATDANVPPNPSIGFRESGGSGYSTVFLNEAGEVITLAADAVDEQGQVISIPADAVKSYRLLAVRRQPMRMADDRPSLRLFEAAGRGSVVLTVEGSSLRHGRVISTVRLEEELQLVPKCCEVSFGGAHGNTVYPADNEGRSVCVADRWGFMAGMATNGTGSLTINGVTTIQDEDDQSVDPLLCVAASPEECQFNPTSTEFTLELVPPSSVPDVRTNPVIAASVLGSIDRDMAPQQYPSLGFQPFLYCTTVVSPTPAKLRECPDGKVTLNAQAQNFPVNALGQTYCGAGNYPSDDHPETADALHCNLSVLNYSGLAIQVVGTQGDQGRALRLYFPSAGDVIRSTGGGTLIHQVQDDGDPGRFALFGCAGCTGQTIRLAGGVEGLNLFAWFPRGTVTIAGGSAYQGVLWANRITSNGGVTWTIPSAEVLAALQLARFGLEGDLNPPVFDWVARSVRSFRWLGL